MGNRDYYLSFPVQLLREQDIKQVVSKAIDYGIIDYMVRHELEGIVGFNYACGIIGISITDANREPEKATRAARLAIFSQNKAAREQEYKATRGVYDTLESSIDKVVYVSIKKDMLFEFRDVPKTDFEIDVFRAFIGVKSILGKKPFQRLTNSFLVARLAGFSSEKEAIECVNRGFAGGVSMECGGFKFHQYHGKRYQIDKLKEELEKRYKLKLYGTHTRGFYVSFTMSLKALVMQAEANKKSAKDKAFKDKKKALILEAKQELKDGVKN